MVLRLNRSDASFDADFSAFVSARREVDEDVDTAVAAIIADIRARGDAALLEFTARFDRLEVESASALRVSEHEIEAAYTACSEAALAALQLAAERIEAYHRKQVPEGFDYIDEAGVRLGARWTRKSVV